MFGKIIKSNILSWKSIPYLLLIPVLLVALLPGANLLGLWESLTFYHTFGPVDVPLSFLIAPRANIGGQGYASLEIARLIIHAFHLPLNFLTFRIPSFFFGFVSLLLFFRICRRWFGPWPAIGATALLAGNQMFFQYEHMMIVVAVSGAALLFVVERLQALEIQYWNLKTWIGLAFAMAFVSLHYGPARIFAVMLVAIWFVSVYWRLKKNPGSDTIWRGVWVLGGYSVVISLFLLALLDYRNLISVLRFSSFLFPKNAETMTLTAISAGGPGVVTMLKTNIAIFVESIFGFIGNFHSPFSSYILADFRYPLLNWFVVPFAILGLVVTLASLRRRGILFTKPWASLLVILAVFSIPLLSSSVVNNSSGFLATLSDHRMYFCLFPLHMLVAAFLYWLANFNIGRIGKYAKCAGALCIIVVFSGLVFNLLEEHSRFRSQVFASSWEKHGPETEKNWTDRAKNVDRHGYLFVSHFQQHAQYANVARQIADKLQTQSKDHKSGSRRIIFVDVNKFSEAPITPIGLDYITNRNYHSIFLTLYAGQEGVQLNPVVMVARDRSPISPNLMSGLAYKGKVREYSALTELNEKGMLTYKKNVDIVPVILDLTGISSPDILVTTSQEEVGVRQLLKEKQISFEYIRI